MGRGETWEPGVWLLVLESENVSCSVVSDLVTPWAARFLCPWNSPGKHTGVGSDFLLQGIFPILVSNWVSHILQADSLPSETPGKSPGFIAN